MGHREAARTAGAVAGRPDHLAQERLRSEDPVGEHLGLVTELGAVGVIVGLPRSMSGVEGPSAAKARQYASVVAARIAPVWVRLIDERLTSVDAHRTLRDSGVSGRRQRAVVDQAAAVLILQNALDTQRTTGSPPGEQVRIGRRKPRTKDVNP